MTGAFLENLQRDCGGSIPIERFMEAALYHPDIGYYTKNIRTVGAKGDFSTWPGLDRSLARAIAAWLRENPARHVIEAGAGTGQLAAGILSHLGWLQRRRATYHIVEISPALRERQKKFLRGRRAVWHASIAEALRAADGAADIFTNEFADAFPCRAFVRDAGAWRELALRVEGGRAQEILIPCELPDSSSLAGNPPDGSRVEVHESYRRWLDSWSPAWKSGRMLTVDYGGPAQEIYSRRPRGTLRSYAHHQRLDGPDVYVSPGFRDITADVNFTDLQNWGERLGFATEYRTDLAEFLGRHGAGRALPEQFRAAGHAFHVLCQTRQRAGHLGGQR